MSSEANLRVSMPAGFTPGDLAPPDFSQSPQLTLEQWQSARDTTGRVALAWGCIGGDASTWSADATELAQGKLAELASGTASRMRTSPTPMHVVSTGRDGRERTLASDGEAASARTFVAFTRDRAHGCFVVCTTANDRRAGGTENGAGACDDAVTGAHVEGSLVSPPPPGLALRSLAFAVHHPSGALATLGAVVALAALLAIATRPSPRRQRRGPSARRG